jgi:hypothetical protein
MPKVGASCGEVCILVLANPWCVGMCIGPGHIQHEALNRARVQQIPGTHLFPKAEPVPSTSEAVTSSPVLSASVLFPVDWDVGDWVEAPRMSESAVASPCSAGKVTARSTGTGMIVEIA